MALILKSGCKVAIDGSKTQVGELLSDPKDLTNVLKVRLKDGCVRTIERSRVYAVSENFGSTPPGTSTAWDRLNQERKARSRQEPGTPKFHPNQLARLRSFQPGKFASIAASAGRSPIKVPRFEKQWQGGLMPDPWNLPETGLLDPEQFNGDQSTQAQWEDLARKHLEATRDRGHRASLYSELDENLAPSNSAA